MSSVTQCSISGFISYRHLGLERMLLEGVVQTSVEMVLFELQGAATGVRSGELAKLIK